MNPEMTAIYELFAPTRALIDHRADSEEWLTLDPTAAKVLRLVLRDLEARAFSKDVEAL